MEPSRTSHPPWRPRYYSPFICRYSRVCGILSYFHAASRGATSSIQRVQTHPAFLAACRRLATTVKDSSVLSSWCNADAKIESSEEQGKQRFWSRAVYSVTPSSRTSEVMQVHVTSSGCSALSTTFLARGLRLSRHQHYV